MSSIAAHHYSSAPESSSAQRHHHDPDIRRVMASAASLIDQVPPPSIREILSAYRSKGDGDRDMLLAVLNAKAAEDQRLVSLASLHRSILEVYQQTLEPVSQPQPPPMLNGNYHYPTPSFSHSPHAYEHSRPSRRSRRHKSASRSRSPNHSYVRIPPLREVSYHHDHPRKRHRSSRSPHPPAHPGVYESSRPSSQHDQFPPSPYSSSDISDSVEYSPRSRASMAIGSLLSSGPRREMNGDRGMQE